MWKRRFRARSCFLAEEMECTEGGASSGTGVERPLPLVSTVSSYYRTNAPRILANLEDSVEGFSRCVGAGSPDCVTGLTARGRSAWVPSETAVDMLTDASTEER